MKHGEILSSTSQGKEPQKKTAGPYLVAYKIVSHWTRVWRLHPEFLNGSQGQWGLNSCLVMFAWGDTEFVLPFLL